MSASHNKYDESGLSGHDNIADFSVSIVWPLGWDVFPVLIKRAPLPFLRVAGLRQHMNE